VTWVGSCEHELVPNGWWLPASMDHPCDTEAVVHVADTEPFSSVFSSSYRRPRAGLSAQEARLNYDVAAWPLQTSLWAANNFLDTHALCEQEVVTGPKPNK
jgi:hypothetical protein